MSLKYLVKQHNLQTCGAQEPKTGLSRIGGGWGQVPSGYLAGFSSYVKCCAPGNGISKQVAALRGEGGAEGVHRQAIDLGQLIPESIVSDDGSQQGLEEDRHKKKVAMWIGYSGTSFRGLQIQRGSETSPAFPTVEGELELALFRAGLILQSNFGNLAKISWSRSSRTDKGVHSLATVVSAKLEVPRGVWNSDPSGLSLAEAVNTHLPDTIRVFSIIPVPKSFLARRACVSRTYHYLLPAALLHPSFRSVSPPPVENVMDPTKDEASSFTVQDAIKTASNDRMTPAVLDSQLRHLQSIVKLFEGKHPFHNYTIRRRYRQQERKSTSATLSQQDRSTNPFAEPSRLQMDSPSLETIKHMEEEETSCGEDQEEMEVADEGGEGMEDMQLLTPLMDADLGLKRLYWMYESDSRDKVGSSLFRKVLLSTVSQGIEQIHGVKFVRIIFVGESFMIHQIRKMVGTSLAVLHGKIPIELIPVSLAKHARMILPLAPPEGLLLVDSQFQQLKSPRGLPQGSVYSRGIPEDTKEGNFCPDISQEIASFFAISASYQAVDRLWEGTVSLQMCEYLHSSEDPWGTWLESLHQQHWVISHEEEEVLIAYTRWKSQFHISLE